MNHYHQWFPENKNVTSVMTNSCERWHWHGIGCWLARCRSQNFIWQVCRNPSWIEKQDGWIGLVKGFFQTDGKTWQNESRQEGKIHLSFPEFPSKSSSESSLLATEEYLSQKGADWRRGDGKIPMTIINQVVVSKICYFYVFSPYLGKWSHLTTVIFFNWGGSTTHQVGKNHTLFRGHL